MPPRPFDLIAFDGDDTLWHNERSYRDGRERFRRLLAAAGVDLSEDDVETCVNRTELANLEHFGYGVSSFALSLIETAIEVTGGRIAGRDLVDLIALGLRPSFNFVEVVSHKTPGVYAAILDRHGIDPQRFLMVGNSLRSDVLPVLQVGGWAVHVPAALSWSHEDADPPHHAGHRYRELPTLAEIPRLVETIEQAAGATMGDSSPI